MKVLVLGANGQLGRAFAENAELAALGDVSFTTRDGKVDQAKATHALDMADSRAISVLLDELDPDLIINAAAYTAVDRAENEEALATQINGHSLSVIGTWAARKQALVVHYSTDYVFDGRKHSPYVIEDMPSPINAYGRSKLAGEHALIASGAPHLLFRTAWVYSAHGHNFLRSMLRLAREREELGVVNDQFGSPTTAGLIAQASLAAINLWRRSATRQATALTGTYHLTSSGVTTWHDFAVAIFERAKAAGLITAAPRVKAISTRDYPTPASRPAWSALDNTVFSQRFGFPLPNWQTGLDDVINELYREANGLTC